MSFKDILFFGSDCHFRTIYANFGRGYCEENVCDIISNLGQWLLLNEDFVFDYLLGFVTCCTANR